MKSVVKMLSAALLVALTIGSCNRDKAKYEEGLGSDKDNIGYLALGGLEASVMEDTENYDTQANTRAGSVDINTFTVTITDASGAVVKEFLYGDMPSEPIALPGGVYKLAMKSGDMAAAAWEAPVYAAEKEFVITRLQTTTVDDIVCKLANIKVTVAYSADIIDSLDPAYTTMTVALDKNELTYAMDETNAGYFAPIALENVLNLTLKCRYKGQDKDIVMTNKLSGVKAAQWRKINVVIQHASDGSATIGIVCDTWTYDEEIIFDTASMIMEEVLVDDTDMPVINWEGHDLAEEFELTDDMFDADGNFLKSINLDVTSKSPLASLVVKVSSDNSDFTAAYSDAIALEQDLCEVKSSMIWQMFGYPTDAKGKTSTRIQFGKQAGTMKSYEGTHTYKITATDENGRSTTETLTVVYGQNVAPRVVWVGYDIKQRYTIDDSLTCQIRVTAPLKIKDFIVTIDSEILTEEELAGFGLKKQFSLVNPGDMASSLENLGFPTGDAVKGQTLVSEDQLNITGFLGILAKLGAADHDFVMSVTDEEGNTTTEVVQLRAI